MLSLWWLNSTRSNYWLKKVVLRMFNTSFSPPYAVSMWTMARHQVEAPSIQWPAPARASSCRPTLFTANGESRSSTVRTATTTFPRSPCPETPPSPVTCEGSFTSSCVFFKCSQYFVSLLLWIHIPAADFCIFLAWFRDEGSVAQLAEGVTVVIGPIQRYEKSFVVNCHVCNICKISVSC